MKKIHRASMEWMETSPVPTVKVSLIGQLDF